jgi:hypothetical protein
LATALPPQARRHLDEAKPSRAAAIVVHHHGGRFDGAGLREQVAQAIT